MLWAQGAPLTESQVSHTSGQSGSPDQPALPGPPDFSPIPRSLTLASPPLTTAPSLALLLSWTLASGPRGPDPVRQPRRCGRQSQTSDPPKHICVYPELEEALDRPLHDKEKEEEKREQEATLPRCELVVTGQTPLLCHGEGGGARPGRAWKGCRGNAGWRGALIRAWKCPQIPFNNSQAGGDQPQFTGRTLRHPESDNTCKVLRLTRDQTRI